MDKLAIDGGAPVRTHPFPTWPIWDEREERELLDVLHSGRWGMFAGSKVKTFEERFAAFQGARFGVCVPNGTLALELALRALGIGPGDEVITSPYTFIATASAALTVGARPVFVDIEPDSFLMDPCLIEAVITERTRAIIPVHVAGRPADMDGILAVARRHNLAVLEDAAQAWGAEWRQQRVGALGDLGTFSFQSSKNITAGEGGIVVTNDDDLSEMLWSLHNVGRVRSGGWYQHELLGGNLRMAEWEAAILLAQLDRLQEHMPIREANARALAQLLGEVPGLRPLPDDPRVTAHGRHLFLARYDRAAFGGHTREEFIAALRAEGITPVSPGYVPLYRQGTIRRAVPDTPPPDAWAALYPVTEAAAEDGIWFFQFALLGDRCDMEDIATAAAKIQRAWANGA
ncbi:MAG: DegT/DnrJ/EryC1/StrS family aminotransferase [Anaerolineae bacterium]